MFQSNSVVLVLVSLAASCLPACVSNGGEPEGDVVHVSPEQDAAVVAALEGHWVAETPGGTIELDICDSHQDSIDAERLWPFEQCVEVAHYVHGDGLGEEQDVEIGSITRTWDDWFNGGRYSETCERVLVAPLRVQVRSWCEQATYDAAARLDASDPYQPPYRLTFALDDGGSSWAVWEGRYQGSDVAEIDYAPGVQCPARVCSDPEANPADCIPDGALMPSTTSIPLRRTGPADCSSR